MGASEMLLIFTSAILFTAALNARVATRHFFQDRSPSHNIMVPKMVEDGVKLSSLSLDFQEDGRFLGKSVTKWLDSEWIPQQVHSEIGSRVQEIYVKSRENGIDDLGEMMMNIGTALESFSMGDAFVNPWDIANKVSDLLLLRLDRELCSCAGDLSSFKESNELNTNTNTNTNSQQSVEDEVLAFNLNPARQLQSSSSYSVNVRISARQRVYKPIPAVPLKVDALVDAKDRLNNEFNRYKFLRDFLEGDIDWPDMHAAVALCLGFREDCGRIYQDNRVEPLGWDGLDAVPDLSNLKEDFVAQRMQNDLPEDDGGTDIVLEQLAGLEMYSMMKNSDDSEVRRRVLLGKWFYIQGFLNDVFPPVERFIPAHIAASLDDDDEGGE